MSPLHDPWFLAAAAIAILLLGLSKGGFAGVGALGTPLLALVAGPVEAAAIMLPPRQTPHSTSAPRTWAAPPHSPAWIVIRSPPFRAASYARACRDRTERATSNCCSGTVFLLNWGDWLPYRKSERVS